MAILSEFKGFPASLKALAPFGPYRAVVKAVVDGDTIDVVADLGFALYHAMRLRLKGIDAPEIFGRVTEEERASGYAAKAFVERLLNQPIVIRTLPDATTFGRYEATVTLADGRDLCDVIVEAGHAVRV
jgi:endonuclease YncB( thermonuclease family)